MPITLDDIKKLSPQKKALFICLAYIVLAYFYWFLFLQSALEERGNLNTKLSELRQQIAEKELKAAGKDKYVREIKALQEAFRTALTKLPDRKDIPSLLNAIELAGNSAGIEFLLFEPVASEKKSPDKKKSDKKQPPPEKKETPSEPSKQKPGKESPEKAPEIKTFYKEIPVKITVNGSFHNTAVFFDKIAKLPRIVNIEEISIEIKDVKPGPFVSTSCVLKTYMFLEKPEEKKSETDEKSK